MRKVIIGGTFDEQGGKSSYIVSGLSTALGNEWESINGGDKDDPHKDKLIELNKLGIAKVTEVEKTGCEGLADFLYEYVNTILLPSFGKVEAERLWCCSVEVRETQSNMAMRTGHREWNEFDE